MENVNSIFSDLPVSVQNIWAILLIVFLFFIAKNASKKIVDIFFGALVVALIFQVLYALGLSKLDEFLHISRVFKYDVFSYIALLFGPESLPGRIITIADKFLTGFISDFATWIIEMPKEAINNLMPGQAPVNTQN